MFYISNYISFYVLDTPINRLLIFPLVYGITFGIAIGGERASLKQKRMSEGTGLSRRIRQFPRSIDRDKLRHSFSRSQTHEVYNLKGKSARFSSSQNLSRMCYVGFATFLKLLVVLRLWCSASGASSTGGISNGECFSFLLFLFLFFTIPAVYYIFFSSGVGDQSFVSRHLSFSDIVRSEM